MVDVIDGVKNWASILDDNTRLQAEMLSRSGVICGHVALMPDAHVGMGATVGSVIPTKDAVIPAAIGVDIGCGMIAVHTGLSKDDLPGDLLGHRAGEDNRATVSRTQSTERVVWRIRSRRYPDTFAGFPGGDPSNRPTISPSVDQLSAGGKKPLPDR